MKWKFCPTCGIEFRPEWRHCPQCGSFIGKILADVFIPSVWDLGDNVSIPSTITATVSSCWMFVYPVGGTSQTAIPSDTQFIC